MRALSLGGRGAHLSLLCLGAHADDIELGAGGTLLTWIEQGLKLDVFWCVLSGSGERSKEAQDSAREFLQGTLSQHIEVAQFRDGYFPAQRENIKGWFEDLKARINPDVILTHCREDAHQDHRDVAAHTWTTFRDHVIFEYEVPKWDGDHGAANIYVPLRREVMQRKIALIMKHFVTQRAKHWFDEEVFWGMARLRGMECKAPERYAEAFIARKLRLC
jgi:LmbE family N-acetylglucosaminyl deacetylase